ncbi:MAG: EI24 domain-containing protein [Paracoccaceae bacterium]|nr:EI24 domain-containing protein [Paracoccaceae bacterium]
MIADFLRALGQMGDPRFRSVLLRGVGLTLALLVGLGVSVFYLVDWIIPDTLTLPRVGEVNWVDDFASGASILLMVVLSAFLMVPVASAFTSLFLDDVADAVEAEHYAHLPPAPRVPFSEAFGDSLAFLGVLILANLAALVLYIFFAPFAPLIFLGLNGFLLGREYFQLVAMRRLGRAGAKAARSRHAGGIWLAGTLMAVPLTIPVINLLVPILGAATFTHLFHRWEASAPTEDAFG